MRDFRLTVKIRNARLLRMIEMRGMDPGQKLARSIGIGYAVLLGYVNLTRSPLGSDGQYRDCAMRLCEVLMASPSDLWSDDQIEPLQKNSSEVDVDRDELTALIECDNGNPLALADRREREEAADELLGSALTAREANIVRLRTGFDGRECTYDQLAEMYGITRERVRQIERAALRKLRHPDHARLLLQMAGSDEPGLVTAGSSRWQPQEVS